MSRCRCVSKPERWPTTLKRIVDGLDAHGGHLYDPDIWDCRDQICRVKYSLIQCADMISTWKDRRNIT